MQFGGSWRRRESKNKMKGNMKLLALICSVILSVAYTQAQTNTTSSTTTSQPATTSNTSNSTTATSSGTVTDYMPGAAISLDPGTGKPVHFVIGDKIQVIGPDGKVLANADVKKNAKVHLHLVQDGDRTVVDQIHVEDAQ